MVCSAAHTFSGIAIIGTIAGYEGIFVGCSAMYVAIADILNEVNGHVVLSVGPVKLKIESTSKSVIAAEPANTVVSQPATQPVIQPVIQLVIQATKLGTQPLNQPITQPVTQAINQPAFSTWVCNVCGFKYLEKDGFSEGDIVPGTKFADIPDNKVCPGCGSPLTQFEKKQ